MIFGQWIQEAQLNKNLSTTDRDDELQLMNETIMIHYIVTIEG